MTTAELMELALLDVLALLDDEERSAFDRAFSAATPEVQAQVRREQTRLARIDALLPDVEAPVTLRARVLAAVRAAMMASASPGEAAALHLARTARPVERRMHGHRRRVTPWWRAAALGATAAAVVLGTLLVQLHSDYQRLESDLKRDALLSQLVETFGSRYVTDAIFDADTQRVAFRPDAPGSQGRAAVWYHPDWDSARFFDLPAGRARRPGERGPGRRAVRLPRRATPPRHPDPGGGVRLAAGRAGDRRRERIGPDRAHVGVPGPSGVITPPSTSCRG